MKYLKILALFLFASMLFVACDGDNEDTVDINTPEEEEIVQHNSNPLISRGSGSSDGLDLGCFSIKFPFEMVDEEGTTYTFSSEDDFNLLLDEEVLIIDFVYPVDVIDSDGNESSAADAEELGELFASCVPQGGWEDDTFPAYSVGDENSCYDLSYPITLEDVDGDQVSVENEEELVAAIAEELYFFVFPIDLVNDEGETVSVANTDEMFEALFSCNEWDYADTTVFDWENEFEYLGCLRITFPLTVELADGTSVTVNDHMELCDLMITGEISGFGFPLNVLEDDGSLTVIDNEEELEEALEACEDFWEPPVYEDDFLSLLILLEGALGDEFGIDPCYDINYPISITLGDDSTVTFQSDEEVENYFVDPASQEELFESSLVYPVSVTYRSDNSTATFNNLDEMLPGIFENCTF